MGGEYVLCMCKYRNCECTNSVFYDDENVRYEEPCEDCKKGIHDIPVNSAQIQPNL